jgi:SAM-dependent methyltransferase
MMGQQHSNINKMLGRYERADKVMGNKHEAYQHIIGTFPSMKGKCLQVGFRGKPYGENWDVLDLYDTSPHVNLRLDIMDTKLEKDTYDMVVASAILEHVPYPGRAVDEMHRILKPGGRVFVAVPFNQPYHPSPFDFFRFTPDGILVIMEQFREIDFGYFRIEDSYIYNGVYFYGEK